MDHTAIGTSGQLPYINFNQNQYQGPLLKSIVTGDGALIALFVCEYEKLEVTLCTKKNWKFQQANESFFGNEPGPCRLSQK